MSANGRSEPGHGKRRAVAVLAVVGWVLALIVAAGPRPDNRTWIGLPALDDLVAVAFLALVIWAVIWTVRVVRIGPGASQTRPANLITLWLGLAVAVAILMVNPSIIDRLLEATTPDEITAPAPVDLTADDPTPPTDLVITRTQVYLAVAAIGGWAAIIALSRRRRSGHADASTDQEVDDAPDLGSTVAGMVEDLGLGSDPRSSVLAAYHRLERALAEQGRARRATETPSEHLSRVLRRLPMDPTPFLDLAHRYERARYSDHPITEDDRNRAAADLTRASDDLSQLAGG